MGSLQTDNENPMAVTKELGQSRGWVSTWTTGLHQQPCPLASVIRKLLDDRIHLLMVFPGDPKLGKLASSLEDRPELSKG